MEQDKVEQAKSSFDVMREGITEENPEEKKTSYGLDGDDTPGSLGDDLELDLFEVTDQEMPEEDSLPSEEVLEEEEAPEEEAPKKTIQISKEEMEQELGEEEPITYRDIPRKRKKHRKKYYSLRFLGIAAAVVLIVAFFLSPVFDIKTIQVEGNEYYSDTEVVNMANAKTGGNIFFQAGKSEILRRLSEETYFLDVSVKRKLPSTLVITVLERGQLAAAIFGDQYIVIDRDGTVLRIAQEDPKVTLIRGLTISNMDVGESLEAEESENLSSTLEMLESMDNSDFYFTEIEVDGNDVVAHITGDLIVRGTYSQLKSAVEDGSLAKVVNRLFQDGTKHGTIQLGEDHFMSFSPEV